MKLLIVKLPVQSGSGRLNAVLTETIDSFRADYSEADIAIINDARHFITYAEKGELRNIRLLFAAELDEGGMNMDACRIIAYLHANSEKLPLKGSVCGILVDGCGQLFTKDTGRRIAFAANTAGCMLPGKPLVEATGDLFNFTTLSELWHTDTMSAYKRSVLLLMDKLLSFDKQLNLKSGIDGKPSILVIHAGNSKTSNSLCLWHMAAEKISEKADIQEISIRNGQLVDCRGCKYEDCLHFGENAGCFYGGVIVEKVYPAIIDADILVLVCPNYNDSVSANIMAFINRLTAVFRAYDFSQKRIYAVIVSGYSGGDIVAQQIIGAINMNKNLILPPAFAIIETANKPGDIMKKENIKEKAAKFAAHMMNLDSLR